MSDKSTEDLHEHMKKQAEMETLKQKVLAEELLIRARNAENKLKQYQEGDKNNAIAKATNYSLMSDDHIAKIQKGNSEYIAAAKNKMVFINDDFEDAIPFFQKNIILLAGQTGDGKSTTVANLIRSVICNKNPVTGQKRRALVITNEEATEDVFNRVTCLSKGWDYKNHDKFTEEQVATFNRMLGILAKRGVLTVIDKNYGGSTNTTSTLEGICQIFDSLIANKEYFDVVLIDYYQNVISSRDNPSLGPYQVQELLANKLDGYKNVYPAAIVLMAQVAPQDKDGKVPFKIRIEGRKSILNVATCCVEIIADKEERVTKWRIHKSRFNGSAGQTITTGWKKGEYVPWTEEFREEVRRWKANAEREAMDKQIGMVAPKVEPTKGEENE